VGWPCPPTVWLSARRLPPLRLPPVRLPVSWPGMGVMRPAILANPRGLTASQHRDRMRTPEGHRETPRIALTARSAARARSESKQLRLGKSSAAPTKRRFGERRARSCRTITARPRMDDPRQQIFSGLKGPKALRAKRHVCFLRGPLWSSFFLRVEIFLLAMVRTPGTPPVRQAPEHGANKKRAWFGNDIENPVRPTGRFRLSPRLPLRRPPILMPRRFGPPMTRWGNWRYRSPIMTTSPTP
jgi:hypothetical protein